MHGSEYRSLVAHMEWADALTWKAVLAVPGAGGDRGFLERLYHVHVVQRVYLQVWRGEPRHVPEMGQFADLAAMATWARPYYAEARQFVDAASDTAFSSELPLPWAETIVKRLGSAAPATLGETVLQVVMHSAHHRAQIATRIREAGGEPPLTDYIAWIWTNRPAAAWP